MWLLFAGISALLSAAAAVVQKKVLFRLNALEFSFAVSAVVLVISLILQSALGLPVLPASVLAVIAAKSVLGACAFLLVMTSLERNQISTALPLLGLTPAAAALLSVPALGETLGVWEVAALVLMIAGTYLIELPPSRRGGASTAEGRRIYRNAPIIGALLLFAVSSVVDKKLVAGMLIAPSVVLIYQHIVYFIVFGFFIALRAVVRPNRRERRTQNIAILVKEHLPAIALAAALTLGYRFAQLEAAKDAPIALVLAVKRTSILFASLYGGRIFMDERLGMKLTGAALIVTAGFLILRFSV